MATRDRYEGTLCNALELFYPKKTRAEARRSQKRWDRALKTMWVDADHKPEENEKHHEKVYQKYLDELNFERQKKKKRK